MLRRKQRDTALLDDIDLTLLRGVEQGLSWRALLASCACDAEETQLRVLRLIHTAHLEGNLGEDSERSIARPAASRTSSPAPSRAPSSAQSAAPGTKTVPPSARAAHEALLRELAARRVSATLPPVRPSEPAANADRAGYYCVRPGGAASQASEPPPRASGIPRSASESEAVRRGTTTAPPGRYSLRGAEPQAATSSAPTASAHGGFSSPLAALIDEYARGQVRERSYALELSSALHEELSGNVQKAIAILHDLTAQLNDPRIRVERDRLQSLSAKATSGIYRSYALRAERAAKHKEAAESWCKVLEACPDDAEAALHAASCNMELGDLRRAGIYARRAAELAPDSVQAHRLLWRFFRKTGMEHSASREREILRKLSKG